MNTYTHFLWAVVLSRWILFRKQKVDDEEEQDRSTSADNNSNSNNNINRNSNSSNDATRNTRAAPEFDRKGALLGSVLPDLPLIATTLVCIVLDYFGEEQENDDGDGDGDSWTGRLFDVWYFSNPWVVAEHNIFHSPVSLSFLILMTYLWYNRKAKKQSNNNNNNTTMEQQQQHHHHESPPASDAVIVTELQQQQQQKQRKPCCCYSCCGPSSFSSGVGSSRFWCWVFVSAMFHALCDIPVHHDDGPLLFWPLNRSYRFVSPLSYWDPNYYGIPFSIGEHLLDLIIVVDILIRFYRRRRRQTKQPWCFRRCSKNETEHDEMEVMMMVVGAATSTNNNSCPENNDDNDDDANDDRGSTKRQHI